MLDFRTEKAQMTVKNGIQHHRTRQILSSSLYALSKELIVPSICDYQTYRVDQSGSMKNVVNSTCYFIT